MTWSDYIDKHPERVASDTACNEREAQDGQRGGEKEYASPTPLSRVLRASEHEEQADLFEWAAYQSGKYPELDLLFACPNGQYRPGQRMEPGLKAGVPDIVLPVARDEFYGLFIELKIKGNTTTPEQEWWLHRLATEGYRCEVAYGFDEARAIILDYLES